MHFSYMQEHLEEAFLSLFSISIFIKIYTKIIKKQSEREPDNLQGIKSHKSLRALNDLTRNTQKGDVKV